MQRYIFEQNQSKNTISEQYEASRMPREHFLKVFEKMKICILFFFSLFHFLGFFRFWSWGPMIESATRPQIDSQVPELVDIHYL